MAQGWPRGLQLQVGEGGNISSPFSLPGSPAPAPSHCLPDSLRLGMEGKGPLAMLVEGVGVLFCCFNDATGFMKQFGWGEVGA